MVRTVLSGAMLLVLAGMAQAEPARPSPLRLEELIAQAEADNVQAQVLLATLHLKGAVPRPDPAKAVRLLESAAAKGNAAANALLGEMYVTGTGVAADPVKGRARLRVAAEAGHAPSQYNLAVMLFTGAGGDRDPVQGVKWLALASANGDDVLRARADAKMIPVARTLGPTRTAEGLEAARQWMFMKR